MKVNYAFDPFSVRSLPHEPYNHFGYAKIITKQNYPSIKGMTVYYIEIFHESMRTIHVHGDCDEIGYVLKGKIQVFIYTPQKVIFSVDQGGSWFIPRGALHSLNNIGSENAKLFVGFNSDMPSNYDLKKVLGISRSNPLFSHQGTYHPKDIGNAIPYKQKPIHWSPTKHFSIHKIILDEKKNSGQLFWYPDSAIFYVNVGKTCLIKIFNKKIIFKTLHYFFIEMGIPHSFIMDEPIELLMFYTSKKLYKSELNLLAIDHQLLECCLNKN